MTELAALAVSAVKAMQQVEALMLERAGSAAIPQLDSLAQVLQHLQQMLAPHATPVDTPGGVFANNPLLAAAA